MAENEARRLELVEQRTSELESAIFRMSDSAKSMADSVSTLSDGMKKLIELEVSHGETRSALGRAFNEIKEVDDRVTVIERELPTLKLARLVIAMCVGGILVFAGNKIWSTAYPEQQKQQAPVMSQGSASAG